jgi:hypothetical protein
MRKMLKCKIEDSKAEIKYNRSDINKEITYSEKRKKKHMKKNLVSAEKKLMSRNKVSSSSMVIEGKR